jgi:hypothetical protein
LKYLDRWFELAEEIYEIFRSLSEKQFEITEDPELLQLHMKAARHFSAATVYNENDMDNGLEYELNAVDETLEIFDYVAGTDKPDL